MDQTIQKFFLSDYFSEFIDRWSELLPSAELGIGAGIINGLVPILSDKTPFLIKNLSKVFIGAGIFSRSIGDGYYHFSKCQNNLKEIFQTETKLLHSIGSTLLSGGLGWLLSATVDIVFIAYKTPLYILLPISILVGAVGTSFIDYSIRAQLQLAYQ